MHDSLPSGLPRRRVLITGANRGIGFATALELVRAGHSVVLTSRDERTGRAAADRLRGAHHGASVESTVLGLASCAAVRRCAADLTGRSPFDVVIHSRRRRRARMPGRGEGAGVLGDG